MKAGLAFVDDCVELILIPIHVFHDSAAVAQMDFYLVGKDRIACGISAFHRNSINGFHFGGSPLRIQGDYLVRGSDVQFRVRRVFLYKLYQCRLVWCSNL